MKVLKKALQRNVILNKEYYTENQIDEMIRNEEVFKISFDESDAVRISLEDVKELKVVLNEYDFYTTVAVGKNDKLYYIEL